MSEKQSRINEAEMTRRALLANLRHELRTPLNAVIGYSEMLIEDAQDDGQDEVVADLENVHSAGKQLLATVNDVLDAKKIESGQMNLNLEEVGISLRHELRTPLNAIIGFSEMLMEDAQDRGENDFFSDMQRILSASQKFLALLDDIVDFQKIESDISKPEKKYFDASVMIRKTVRTIHSRGAKDTETEFHGRILVVDDNEMNRDLLSRYLEREGHQTIMADNGMAALKTVQTQPFDLILLDIMMPEMNGFQVLEQLKGHNRHRHIPVIMISALDEMSGVVRCIESGAEDYLPKPFDPVLLRARVNACLEKKHMRDQEVLYLSHIEAEKKRADDLLHVILPDQIIEELKTTNKVLPRYYPDAAILFTDVVSFTPYCNSHSPEDVLINMQKMVLSFEDIALKYRLQKIKTIGDAFMAAAGLLTPLENPVFNCVNAGLEMISAIEKHVDEWRIRIGIHVGTVMAGIVGHRQYLFDVWGDTVNTAQRIESNGLPGTVCLSRDAWMKVSSDFRGESRGAIELKGKGEMEIFRIIGV